MIDRHTKELRAALLIAMWAVDYKRGSAMEPEHVVAAILLAAPARLGPDKTRAVLRRLGYPDILERRWLNGERFVPFSERTRACLAAAVERADALHHRWVRSEHVVEAIIALGDSEAARALLAAGVVSGSLEAAALSRPPDDNETITAGPWVQVSVAADEGLHSLSGRRRSRAALGSTLLAVAATAASFALMFRAGCAVDLKGGALGDPLLALHLENLALLPLLVGVLAGACAIWWTVGQSTARRGTAVVAWTLFGGALLWVCGVEVERLAIRACF